MWGYIIALWLYLVGSGIMFFFTMYEDEPWHNRVVAVIGWPIAFPIAMIFRR